MKTKVLIVIALLAAIASAQQSDPGQFPNTTILPFDYATGGPQFFCYTTPHGPWNNGSVPATFTWTKAATTLTNIVVLTNTATATTSAAHGLAIGNRVTVAGVLVDPDLNGSYVILTVPTSTTFTFTTASVSNATYVDATMTLSSTAPRTTVAIWSIEALTYDSSNNLSAVLWAGGNKRTYTNICANRATLSYQ